MRSVALSLLTWFFGSVFSCPLVFLDNGFSGRKDFQTEPSRTCPVLPSCHYTGFLDVTCNPSVTVSFDFVGFRNGSGKDAFEVRVWPEQLALELGGDLNINCSTSCVQPETGGLETTLTKTVQASQPQWIQYLLSNVSEDSVIHCYFTCSGKQLFKSASISVFYPPKQVKLKLQPTWVVVGRPFSLECKVLAVVPLEKLTLTLLRGTETLHNQTFRNATVNPQEIVVTHNFTAHQEDNHRNFSCRAELDLRALGGELLHSVSAPQVLKVYVPPQDNQMTIIIAVVSVLLFLFVTSVLLCFVFGQHWHQRRTGAYGVQAAWRGMRWPYRAQPTAQALGYPYAEQLGDQTTPLWVPE
ncbi:Intercellular adhesion molecule 2 [Galemys pyrenaicus]|uniref:Intercellular adhesion molecule 2 n=1 Tax=Galemys pyrenaicus TaxID=202257 RepID=A0A8J5ZPH1_GALPY|nr:Intercellular adhesion molecule 2 [Galemys pyrenaicus]